MKTLIISIKIFLLFTLLTGIVYPLFLTGVAKLAFPDKAKGSLILKNNQVIGSTLLGQQFDTAIYFSSRPSAVMYNPMPSGGSNYSITNANQIKLVENRKRQFLAFNKLDSLTIIPSEMLFASASGLDPHISPEAALLQVNRIAGVRNFSAPQKQKLLQCIKDMTEPPQFLCLGEPRVNVLLLNLEADKIR